MRWDLVIFDCDGVLIDSELLSVRAVRECFAESGIQLTEAELRERYTGISWAGMIADLETRHGALPADLSERHRRIFWPLLERELQPIPGIAAVLDSLSCKVCVASSGRPERLRHALSIVGLYDRFHPHVFSAVEVPRGKPAPDLFLHAAARMDAPLLRCVVIEDSVPGVIGAVAAGMTVIGFVGASHCRPEDASRLAAHGAAAVIDDMAKLLPALA
ncbi:MAG: HAD family hydrolase [Alphaproteobacteria bacterium]|nr:HAD family hydrolase [Alphaproteobacteria bacterium]